MKLPLKQMTLGFAIALASLGFTSGSTKVSASNRVIASMTTPVDQPTLKLGMQGQEVKKLQEELKEIGFYHGRVTGDFDSSTQVAVKEAQQTYGLAATGVVDPATRRAFWRNLSTQRRIKMEGANRGAPGQREAAGTRAGRCPAVDSALTALVPATQETLAQDKGRTSALTPPESVLGLTAVEYPTFWFYVPYSPNAVHSTEFVLLDEKDNYVYKTTLRISETPGVVSFRLPSTVKPLEIGKSYRWYFLIACDQQKPSRSVFVNGWVQRVAPNPALLSQLQTATPQERVALYAARGIWHEAQTTLAELRRTYPQNAAIAADWFDLLQSVGLEELAHKPIVAGLQP